MDSVPPTLLSSGYRRLYPWMWSGRAVKLTIAFINVEVYARICAQDCQLRIILRIIRCCLKMLLCYLSWDCQVRFTCIILRSSDFCLTILFLAWNQILGFPGSVMLIFIWIKWAELKNELYKALLLEYSHVPGFLKTNWKRSKNLVWRTKSERIVLIKVIYHFLKLNSIVLKEILVSLSSHLCSFIYSIITFA
jgi:hypothetical protein